METISVNKQLLQEDSRGTEKSDTNLARRQESRWLSSEVCFIRNIYVQQNSTHFWVSITCLRLLQCHTSDCKQQIWHTFFYSYLFQPPRSCASVLLPFFPSPNLYSKPITMAGFPLDSQKGSRHPKLQILAWPPCILSAWNLQVSGQGLSQGASPFKHLPWGKKKNKQQQTNQNTIHFASDSGI